MKRSIITDQVNVVFCFFCFPFKNNNNNNNNRNAVSLQKNITEPFRLKKKNATLSRHEKPALWQ